ncbi:Probable chloride channel protein [Flavobacterium indicum GPTSA100-9 = DSM 17447]|uniref:Probable chloride channel protein n=1 Tax=Flavobacterium indicum (strain DSM 17447 / CIP 109464 / GPTSA100-9) TaxID=1094466 RepID=H8XQZ9_FLAIG|nr:Probable chloride channel protein [Flavobacterium indicum GPTSA100-9 = DSM 17447]
MIKNNKISDIFFRTFRRFELFFMKVKTIVGPRQFIYISSVLVGLSAALAVIVLKTFAHSVYKFSQYLDGILHLPYSNSTLPIIGILLTVLVIKKVLKGSIDKGTSQIMYAVAKTRSVIPSKQMYAQIITSSLTVGMGGSAGLESPITITGAAFGSNYALNYRLSYKDRTLLLACGVAAGVAAAFNAPIAGVLFAIEVVLAEISITAFTPLIISAATGAIVSSIVLKEDILFSFKQIYEFENRNLPYYILLGILSGFVSIHYARNFRRIEAFFAKRKTNSFRKALTGSIVLGILIFIFPTLFGEGYESIKLLADNQPEKLVNNSIFEVFSDKKWVLLLFISATLLIKVFATGITLGSGGNGGNFAPSLFVGSYLGFSVAYFFNYIGITKLPIGNFTLVGMAGVLSGLFHAPLTAIFLIAEITGGYGLMVPLMLVSSISYAISKRFEPYSFDIKHLADRGEVFTDDKDKNILQSIDFKRLIDTKFSPVKDSKTLDELIEKIKNSDDVLFPVLNDKNDLIGLIHLDDVRPIIFSAFKIKYTSIHEVVQPIKTVIQFNDTVDVIMDKFETSQQSILPVIQDKQFIGFLHKSDILEKYRDRLKEIIIE